MTPKIAHWTKCDSARHPVKDYKLLYRSHHCMQSWLLSEFTLFASIGKPHYMRCKPLFPGELATSELGLLLGILIVPHHFWHLPDHFRRSHHGKGHEEEGPDGQRQIRTRGTLHLLEHLPPNQRICLSYYFMPLTNSSNINGALTTFL